MESKLTFQYDRETYILYINVCPPYPEQESEENTQQSTQRWTS